MQILFAASEAYPLIKTGGLADVCGNLPRALLSLDCDVRLVLPAYREVVAKAPACKKVGRVNVAGIAVDILETRLPGTRVKIWLVDYPPFFDRPGNPYHDDNHQAWPDSAARFLLFSRAIVELATNRGGLDWSADVVHCNDWQTALVPALLAAETARPATVFTIHNLAYQGLFSYADFVASGLPVALWDYRALEFHGQFSFIKGGLVYADRINTVSPTYAEEIKTAAFGYGLDGLLLHRSTALNGILNGIDINEWNPATDEYLGQRYNSRTLKLKQHNKRALQAALNLTLDADIPLIGCIGRLVEQKGVDLLLAALPRIVESGAQLALLGSGAPHFEEALQQAAAAHPEAISVTLGYSENLAHRIEGSADLFLMPSRFEPCGLNQMYSLRYGTVPVVHRVGGLADTVIDPQQNDAETNGANGFCFTVPTAAALWQTLERALTAYRDARQWQRLQLNGMRTDFSWRASAQMYRQLYDIALGERAR
jgi:starch synthase